MKNRKPNWSRIIPWSLGLLIFICVLITVIKLAVWNKGEAYGEVDPSLVMRDTDDNITIRPPSLFRTNTPDDGTATIVVFGNDSYYEGLSKSESVMDYFKAELDKKDMKEVVIYNFTLPGSRIASYSNVEVSPSEIPEDYFTFYWLSVAKKLDMLPKLREALSYLDSSKYDIARYEEVLNEYEALDMNTVDFIFICYDGQEYINGIRPEPVEAFDGITGDPTTILGSLASSIYVMNAGYPDIQYVYMSPIFCYTKDDSGKKVACDKYDTGFGSISVYLDAARNTSTYAGMSYLDLFTGIDLYESNANSYLESDGITPNKKARQMMAERIATLLSGRLQ